MGRRRTWPVLAISAGLGLGACASVPVELPPRPASPEITVQPMDPADVEAHEQVDRAFAEWDREGSPGAAVVVVRGGEVVLARGYGEANLEYGVAITPATPFHVASVSKQFTAYAVGLLAEEGALSLDDDVRLRLPWVPDFGHTITLRHLIHHTSGLRDQWELLATAGWRLDDVITTAQILDLVRHQEALNFPPGTEYLYSNTGYTLLAEVVEAVTGQTLAEFTERRIFGPLEMEMTHFHDDHRHVVHGRAYSYAPAGGAGWRHAPLNYATVGATSLFTTAHDLARWEANLREPVVGSATLVREMEGRGVLTTGDTIAYARAVMIGEHRGTRTVSHGGADAGYRSHYLRLPEKDLAVIVLSNVASMDAAGVARQVADAFLGHRALPVLEIPGVATGDGDVETVRVPPERIARLAGLYAEPYRNQTRQFEMEEGRLILRAGRSIELRALGDDRFLVATGIRPIVYTFEVDGEGTVTAVREEAPAERPIRYEAVPRQEPDRLAELAGVYHSPELGTEYLIAVENGQLVARHRRHGRIELLPTLPDRALGDKWWLRDLRFTRDHAGRVDGFLLTGSRVRDLRFDRVEPRS
jgi:CubicO group peptidase (beta-lactamase class C family)